MSKENCDCLDGLRGKNCADYHPSKGRGNEEVQVFNLQGVLHLERTIGQTSWVIYEEHLKALAAKDSAVEGLVEALKFIKDRAEKWGYDTIFESADKALKAYEEERKKV